MAIPVFRGPLVTPPRSSIQTGRDVSGSTFGAIAQTLLSLLAHRGLGQSQAVVQVGNWRSVEGAGGTPATSTFSVFHQVGPLAQLAAVSFWYTRDEEKPTGSEEAEILWKDSSGTTFATTTWGDDALEPTDASQAIAVVAGILRTRGALAAAEQYAAPESDDGSDPEPRLVDVSAYRGEIIELQITIDDHRLYSVHVADVVFDAY